MCCRSFCIEMRFIGLIILFISSTAVGQSYPTKKQIKKFLTVKLNPGSNYDKWVNLSACNTDENYFKADTVKLYNDDKANWINSCCQFVDWNFDKKKLTFYLSKGTTCMEPSRATPGQFQEIKIIKENKRILLLLNIKGKEVDKFRVIGLKNIRHDNTRPVSQVMILVREKKRPTI